MLRVTSSCWVDRLDVRIQAEEEVLYKTNSNELLPVSDASAPRKWGNQRASHLYEDRERPFIAVTFLVGTRNR